MQSFNDGQNNMIIGSPQNYTNSYIPIQFQVSVSPNPLGISDQDLLNSIQTPETPDGEQKISNNTLTIDGITAYETTDSINDSSKFPVIMTSQHIDFTKNGKTYSLDFIAPNNDFNNEQSYFNILVNSLQINGI